MECACDQLGLDGLIRSMAGGHEPALTEFHNLMANRLHSMALHILQDHAAAADALQDCMVRVWRSAAKFDCSRSDAFAWTSMILRGICLDHLRQRRRRDGRLTRWQQEQSLAEPRRGMEDLFFRETVGLVQQAMSSLSADERDCLESALFTPDTTATAAARMGLTTGTLKVRTHRAMQRLRSLLGTPPNTPL